MALCDSATLMMNALCRQWVKRLTEPLLRSRTHQVRTVILHDVPLDDVARVAQRVVFLERIPNTHIDISCDDGFRSSYAFLMRLNIPATFYVCPTFIGMADGVWEEFVRSRLCRQDDLKNPHVRVALRPCSWEDLRRLVRRGHIIGCHTMTHANLAACLTQAQREQEIVAAADRLEDVLGVPVRHFAYPFGTARHINRQAMALIQSRYDTCATGLRGNNAMCGDPYLQWRDAVSPSWDQSMLTFVMRGGLDWRYALRRRRVGQCV